MGRSVWLHSKVQLILQLQCRCIFCKLHIHNTPNAHRQSADTDLWIFIMCPIRGTSLQSKSWHIWYAKQSADNNLWIFRGHPIRGDISLVSNRIVSFHYTSDQQILTHEYSKGIRSGGACSWKLVCWLINIQYVDNKGVTCNLHFPNCIFTESAHYKNIKDNKQRNEIIATVQRNEIWIVSNLFTNICLPM